MPERAVGGPSAAGGGSLLGFRHKRVQRVRRLVSQSSYRHAERAFVAEGAKLVGEALRAGAAVEGLYIAPGGFDQRAVADVVDVARGRGIRVFGLGPQVMERVTDTVTPQPVLAVAGFVDQPLETLRDRTNVLVCVDVRDPGNLGTILRTAEAAGMGGVICCEGTVDVYNPKCVRASAGSMFHVRLVAGGGPVEVLEGLGAQETRRLGTAADRGVPYSEVAFDRPTAIVLGNEAHGLPDSVAGLIDEWVTIPMAGRSESLNVGMAAAVLCFEAARQLRSGHAGRHGRGR